MILHIIFVEQKFFESMVLKSIFVKTDLKLKKMKRLFLLLAILLIGKVLFAQTFVVPKDYVFNTPEDFRKYEQQIIQCIDYLNQTPLNKEVANRQAASEFFIKWIYGTPDIEVVVYKKIIPFINNKPLFEIFLCGYVAKEIELKSENKVLDCYINGIKDVVQFYQKNRKQIRRSASVEKYSKLYKEGKLEQYLKQKVEKL